MKDPRKMSREIPAKSEETKARHDAIKESEQAEMDARESLQNSVDEKKANRAAQQ
jgi:hypothetical protein